MTTIQDLEQQLGIQLTQQTDITSVRQFHTKCGYCCNEREEVIALAIIKTEIESIHLPASFQSLRYLNLGSNAKLKSLTFEGSLPHLEHLDISDSALESLTLPYSCGQLKWLDVSRNQIQYQILFGAELPNLKYLDVSGNQLTALELPNCPKLQYLYAADNQIDFLEIYSTSKELEVLHLRNNKLEVLPNNLLNLMALNSLYLHGNPLSKLPAEVISQDERGNSFADVRNHLLSIAEDGAAENDEIKLVLLGNSTAGKTSLLRYLTEQQYDESLSSTHGIQNRLWQAKDKAYFVNIWDFGGQEYYHATHRLFLSQNAVSLILFEQATNRQTVIQTDIKLYENGKVVQKQLPLQHFPYAYWLDSLCYFSQTPHVEDTLLVQSKMDIENAKSISVSDANKAKYGLDEEHIFRLSVKGAAEATKKYQRRYEDFEEQLFEVLEANKAKYEISSKWLEIKRQIRKIGKDRIQMSYDEYVAFCEQIRPDISEKQANGSSLLDTLTAYLYDISVILYYPKIEALKDTVFVYPQWVTDTIYKVLDYSVIQNEGKFNRAHVEAVIGAANAEQIIALMQQFELVFAVKNTDDQYIAPQYLPEKNPEQKSYNKSLRKAQHSFTLHYSNFMPSSVMTRLIARYGNLAEDVFWKRGIVFEQNEVSVIVQSHPKQKRISVHTDQLDQSVIAGLFADFQSISERNPSVEVSVDGENFVAITELIAHPVQNPKIKYISGELTDFANFGLLLGKTNLFFKKEQKSMKGPEPIDQLHNLIERNRIESALGLLDSRVEDNNQKIQVVKLKQDWSLLQRDKRLGVLDSRDESTRQNKLVLAILDLGNEILGIGDIGTDDSIDEPPTPATSKGKIFFSYAWGVNDQTGQNREALVDQLYNSLEADGIDVIRDKKDLNYGELISTFMEQIGQGDLVIVFTSKKYARSPYCMFELYEIARNSRWDKEAFRKQILPVIVEYVPFNEPNTLIEYLNYWKNKQSDWETLIQQMTAHLGEHQMDEYQKIKKINQNFGDLVGWLGDINASNNKLLADNDFALVKTAILQRLNA